VFEIKAEGLDELMKALKEFTPQIQKRVLGTAMRNAMKPVMMTARSNARALDDPQTPSNISKNIISQRASKKAMRQAGVRDADMMQRVGVRGGAKDPKTGDPMNTFYWRFHEFGTSKIAARPFMRPALAQNTQRTTAIMVDELKKGIDRTARRLAKR
jgi:HK97 gp10 family phage protein